MGDATSSPAVAAAPPGRALKALWYDGLSSQGRRVHVMIQPHAGGPQLVIEPISPDVDGIALDHRQVQWPQTYGRGNPQSRLTVALGAHGSLEVQNAAQWHEAYTQAGGRRKMAERLQTGWRILFGFTVACVLTAVLFFRYGTPVVATQLARFVPIGWETAMTETSLEQLDRYLFEPSALPARRQADLRERFDAMVAGLPPPFLRYRGYQPLWRLEFRSGFGANALAFPGGLLVMTDEMVALADRGPLGDVALMGVLAHEIGHVVHRHSSRMLIEQGVLNATLSVAMGDVSGWVALASTSLTAMAYSRNHEREADCFAMALMRHQALDTAPLAALLAQATGVDSPASGSAASTRRQWDWLSTHPDSGLRVADLHAGEAGRCDLATARLR